MSTLTDKSHLPGKRISKEELRQGQAGDKAKSEAKPAAQTATFTGWEEDAPDWQEWPDNDEMWQSEQTRREAERAKRTCRECWNKTRPLRDGLCRRCYGRATAITTAQQWLADDPLFLEVNSTGLGDADQVIEIAVLDSDGNALLNTLVKPTCPITAEATTINGLTDGALAAAPDFAAVGPTLYALLKDRRGAQKAQVSSDGGLGSQRQSPGEGGGIVGVRAQ